ncbi:hypothetical protein BD779DRAFT_1680018 [Infundibulicybe gibba]|nr:hypothetical protein BD779DRAFT_1680018 [Infundibulicybe gibba]
MLRSKPQLVVGVEKMLSSPAPSQSTKPQGLHQPPRLRTGDRHYDRIIPSTPTIPQVLQALADIQLPTTRAFSYAHRGDFGDFSVEDLDRCQGPPPYALPSIWDDPAYLDEEHFFDILHGSYSHEQRSFEKARLRDYNTVAHEVFVNEVLSMLTRSISEWETAERIIGKRNGDTIEDRLGNQYLQWRARWVIDLAADYNALLLGNDKFLCTFVERWRHLE